MAMIAYPPSAKHDPSSPEVDKDVCSGPWACAAVAVVVGLGAALVVFVVKGLLPLL